MQQIRFDGDTGPHGQQGALIGPEPLQADEKPTKPEDTEDTTIDPKQELVD